MYDENSIVEVIEELKLYRENGVMNINQIETVIESLQEIYIREIIVSFKMMDEDDELDEYIRKNMKMIAKCLNRSLTTIYRKVHDHSFTLIELEMIKKMRIESQ